MRNSECASQGSWGRSSGMIEGYRLRRGEPYTSSSSHLRCGVPAGNAGPAYHPQVQPQGDS